MSHQCGYQYTKGGCVKGFAKVTVNNKCYSALVHQTRHPIAEGNWLGQALICP